MLSEAPPRVSVIIPNYNHASFLPQRLDSVFGQTFNDMEVIILDDASTDNSREVIQRYVTNPRVQISFNEINSGSPFAQWNKGVHLARGKYVWIAESDDRADPHLLEVMVSRLESDPSAVLAYCQSQRINEDDLVECLLEERRVGLYPARWNNDYVNDGREECRQYMIITNIIVNASAVIFRRTAYLESGGADETYRICGDWLTWSRISMLGRVMFVAQLLNYHRLHPLAVRKQHSSCLSLTENYRVLGTLRNLCDPQEDVLSYACNARAEKWAKVLLAGGIRSLKENWMVYRVSRTADRWAPFRTMKCIVKMMCGEIYRKVISIIAILSRR